MNTKLMQSSSRYLLQITLVATLGGLLFGYDTAVISGAIIFLKTEFSLTAIQEGWAVSSALIGCVIGVSMAGYLSDRFGRRPGLMLSAALFLVSAIGSALPQNLDQFVVARMLGGMGIGVASMLSPVYIAEIAPSRLRGRLVALNQFAIITGMLVTYFVNWALVDVPGNWRWMLGSEAIPALAFLLLLLKIPETPRWLFVQGEEEKAREILKKIGGEGFATTEFINIKATAHLPELRLSDLWRGPLRRALLIGLGLAIFQQITGINTVLYYTPRIFLETGWADTNSAFVSTIVVGLVNIIFTLFSIYYIDRWGRRPLLAFSLAGMGLSLCLLGWTFLSGTFPPFVTVLALLAYVAFFMVGLGPGYWVVISEIFPGELRGRAVSIATTMLWASTFAISLSFPLLLESIGAALTFWSYAAACLAGLIFVVAFVPETKNKSLEEIHALWEPEAQAENLKTGETIDAKG